MSPVSRNRSWFSSIFTIDRVFGGRERAAESKRQRSARLSVEGLESRTLLTTTLYIDYGDNFASGVLAGPATTVGNLKTATTAGNPPVDGPQLTDATGAAYPDATTFNMTSLANVFGAATAATMRATADAMLQRFFAPLNITVVDLTAANQSVNGHLVKGAASLNDISTTLGANNADAQHNDGYVLVGLPAIGPTLDNPNFFASNGYGGKATLTDIGKPNAHDGTALVLLSNGYTAQFLADQIAHEAAHTFGLIHTFGNNPDVPPAGSDIVSSLYTSDMMSYLAYANFGGFDFFTRYPLARGDGNTDNTVLSSVNMPFINSPTPFDQLISDANIGPNPNMNYVTGTGANDIITITKTGVNQATVSVQAFLDAAYTMPITVPGPGNPGTTYTYTIALGGPIVADGGSGNDRFVIDANLGVTVTTRGMAGTDELVVQGNGVATGSYTPGTNTTAGLDGNPDRRGTVVAGSTTINFQEFDPDSKITVQNIIGFTLHSPGGSDSLQVDTPTAGQNRISGTVNTSVPMVPMLFSDVTSMTVDTSLSDTASAKDSVSIDSNGLTATGLKNFTVNTGAGNDTFTINSDTLTLPVAGGAISYDGGLGNNTLAILGSAGTKVWTIDGANSGNVNNLAVKFTRAQNLTGGAQVDEFIFKVGGKVGGNINGGAGGDWLDYTAQTTSVRVNLNTGLATLLGGLVSNVENVIGSTNGADTLTGNASGGVLAARKSNNTLVAGSGKSVLIGGYGKNTLTGGAGDALLIAGSTIFEGKTTTPVNAAGPNYVALTAILAEWQSAQTYNQRVADLRTGANLAAGNKLILNVTVFVVPGSAGPRIGYGGGFSQSTLVSGGGLNWYFTGLLSAIVGRKPGEQVN